MPEFLKPLVQTGASIPPDVVLVRLLAAVALGLIVAAIYWRVRRDEASSSLAVTLVLLCVLIAMVSQVVGDNVARAFSLVGALSIARFRTVVKDTQDTAYVIFAVVVGMAAGTSDLWVAIIGILVIGAAAFAMAKLFREQQSEGEYWLRLRIPPGQDLATLFAQSIEPHLEEHDLVSLGTAKGRTYIEVTYRTRLRPGVSVIAAASAISAVPGIEDVQLRRLGSEDS